MIRNFKKKSLGIRSFRNVFTKYGFSIHFYEWELFFNAEQDTQYQGNLYDWILSDTIKRLGMKRITI